MNDKLDVDIAEAAHILIEDIDTVFDHFRAGRVDQKTIRNVFGPILRRWVNQGDFHHIQKALRPHQFRFEYYVNNSLLRDIERGLIGHWVGEFRFESISLHSSAFKDDNAKKRASPENKSHLVNETASKFFKQKICFIENTFYSRKDVISFHANNLGGAHLRDSQAIKQDGIRLQQTLGYEAKGNNIQMLIGPEIATAKKDSVRRKNVYDLADLLLLDTTRIFMNGVNKSREELLGLLV